MSSKRMNSNMCDCFNNPDVLRRIMRLFTDGMNCTKTYNGYHMLACDGTDVNIPYNSKNSETYHSLDREGSKGYNQLHLNDLYDIENGIFQDTMIDTNDKTNETYALEEMIKHIFSFCHHVNSLRKGYHRSNPATINLKSISLNYHVQMILS